MHPTNYQYSDFLALEYPHRNTPLPVNDIPHWYNLTGQNLGGRIQSTPPIMLGVRKRAYGAVRYTRFDAVQLVLEKGTLQFRVITAHGTLKGLTKLPKRENVIVFLQHHHRLFGGTYIVADKAIANLLTDARLPSESR